MKTKNENEQWSFPELNPLENAEIIEAREKGYAEFFPCVQGALVQGVTTLMGARNFLGTPSVASVLCPECRSTTYGDRAACIFCEHVITPAERENPGLSREAQAEEDRLLAKVRAGINRSQRAIEWGGLDISS